MLEFIVEETTTGDIWIMDNNSPYDKLIAHNSKIDVSALVEFLNHIREITKND